ncbi:HtaA domain-containing protein [Arthrobacter sp. B6]|uniref:HtaA domain-containing protein n=1 Tax=Arthrobacter sp. B6 TaxID=1570137 RepID=UPI0008327D66|nr:HtaA domain-containing protein [Arthrobacter sp. B6]
MIEDAAAKLQGELRWNIKSRFREYVRSLPDGAERWISGPGGIEPESIAFGLDSASSFDSRSGLGILKFAGSIRFEGYHGALRVDISDPWIEIEGEKTQLTVNRSPQGLSPSRVAIAIASTLPASTSADRLTWEDVPTALTQHGSTLLGGVYPPGSEADPCSFWVST